MWIHEQGCPNAQALLAAYPSPRALRVAMQDPAMAATVVALVGPTVHPRDVFQAVQQLARSAEAWQATDGTITRRWL